MPVSDRVGDVIPHVLGAHLDSSREVDHSDLRVVALEKLLSGLPHEESLAASELATDKIPHLSELVVAHRCSHESRRHAGELAERPTDIGDVVEHEVRDRGIEGALDCWNRFDGADPRVDPTSACEVDHLLGLVEGDHLHSGCLYSRCEVAGATAKLDHALRLELEQSFERDVIRWRPGAT